MLIKWLTAFALVSSAGATAIAQGVPVTRPAQEYVLGPGDVIEVSVLGRDDFKARVRIAPDGSVLLPFLNAVQAAGRTPTQLRDQLRAALRTAGIFADPAVSVDVVSYVSQYVTVLGAVASPGLVPIDRAYRLSEIIARVGGTRTGGADYVVLRAEGQPERRYPITAIATGGDEQDPLVPPGAKLYVPVAESFFIYGEVNSPGAHPIMAEPTLRKALAQGGGVKATGTHRRIKLFRQGRRVRDIDLAGPIQPGDVIVVGERLF